MKTHMAIALGLALLLLLLSAIAAHNELRAFRDDVLKEQARIQERIRKQEQKLNETVLRVTEQVGQDVNSINTAYTDLLNERGLLNTDGGVPRVSDTPSSTRGTGQAATSKPPATGAGLSTKLKRCEAALIYEAREYDILATHYNALLAIYKQAQEVTNGNGKKDGGKGD